MKKMKRWASVLLTVCMLIAAMPHPAMAEPAGTPMAAQTAMTPEPTGTPESAPTSEPTEAPTAEATEAPTPEPTEVPTSEPTEAPTPEATDAPMPEPTDAPTPEPTEAPTAEPTDAPTSEPADAPTAEPMLAAAPAARAADVTLTIEADWETAPEGYDLNYTVRLTNVGDSATEQLSVNIDVPEDKLDVVSVTPYAYTASWDSTGVWTVKPLEPGQTARFDLSATVLTVETGEVVTVTASIPDGPADSASFTGIGGYRIEGGTAIITGSVNLDDVVGYSFLTIEIEATGTVTGGVSHGDYVRNSGTITGGTFRGSVDNEGGTITGGVFYSRAVRNAGTITGGVFYSRAVRNAGTITGGTFYSRVDNESGTITGGTFNEALDNNGDIQGSDANALTINGEIRNEGSILQPCNFGGNARVRSNTGTIQVVMLVNGQEQIYNYGDRISETLGGGTWCLLNEDSFSVCDAGDTFGLQTRSYGVLSAPNVVLDHETESITVTVPDYLAGLTAEDEVYLGFPLDIRTTWEEWNDVFASSGSYTSTLSRINSINEMFTGNPLPRNAGDGDVEIPVFFGSGTVVSDAYPGAVTTLVVPERPECGRVEPLALITDVDRLGIDAALCDTYDFGLAPAGGSAPDEPTILDEDGDGLITGLKEGEEYIVYLRLKATDSSFRSAWQAQGSATTAAATYTVTYTDGVDGEEVFADQVTGNLLVGEATPAFNGTPEREGYVFAGWNPAVAATVSGDATYTATWQVDRNGNGTADEGEPKYTVTYTDGVEGEEIFADQATGNLLVGDATPAFNGTPERQGYMFAGWNPAVAATVSGDATYTATWQVDRNGNGIADEDETKYTVTYTDGVEGEEIFADQVMDDLLTGEATPAFNGTPERQGYMFAGWNPAVAATVSGDVTYTATWKVDRNGNGIADEGEPKYTVTYTDGVDGEEVFGDQITGNLLEGDVTPAFNGTPERQGYMFAGWNPAVTATVSGNATYTATWKKEAADERDGYDPAETAQKLAAGEAVEGVVTNRHGEFMPYKPSTQEVTDERTQEVIERRLVIAAGPVRNEDGEIVLRDGEPVYEQRNLHLSRELLEALSELGYTHIRFVVKDAALEWAIADMGEEGNIIRLAPMEAEELSQAERGAMGEAEQLSGAYRARITAVIDGKETDITAETSLTAWFDAKAIRALAEGETAQCLLVPGDGEPEEAVSTAEYVEEGEGEDKETSYQAKLSESGLFVLMLQ